MRLIDVPTPLAASAARWQPRRTRCPLC